MTTRPPSDPAPDMAPDVPGPDFRKRARIWGILTIVCLLATLVPPLIGMLGTVIAMLAAFRTAAEGAQADPEVLADRISLSLLTTAGGLAVSGVFLVFFLLSFVFWLINLSAARNRTNEP